MSEPLDKAAWRKRLLAARDALSDTRHETDSEAIKQRVLHADWIAKDHAVLAYASAGSEVRTYTLIEGLLALGARVALPVIGEGHAMTGVFVTSLKDLAPDRFGLLAPRPELRTDQRRCEHPEVALVPGVGFDAATGHRLGRGAGYYDRYLSARPGTRVVGLAFDEQVADGLPFETHDIPMHAVVTPMRVLRFS